MTYRILSGAFALLALACHTPGVVPPGARGETTRARQPACVKVIGSHICRATVAARVYPGLDQTPVAGVGQRPAGRP